MSFTKLELLVFKDITKKNYKSKNIIYTTNKSKSQIFRVINKLIKKSLIIKKSKNKYILLNSSFTILLFNLIDKYPNLIEILSDSGMIILSNFINKSSVKQVSKITGFKKTIIYNIIKLSNQVSILKKDKDKYYINSEIWKELIDLLTEYRSFENILDYRIPKDAIIYYKNKKEIIFSCKSDLNAALTSFSVFDKYNIKILSSTNYFYLPNKKLNKKEILEHTIKIIERTKDFRQIIYLALFYYKYMSEFKEIKHVILNNLNKIFNGEKIYRYPPLKEIKEKARLYNIKM